MNWSQVGVVTPGVDAVRGGTGWWVDSWGCSRAPKPIPSNGWLKVWDDDGGERDEEEDDEHLEALLVRLRGGGTLESSRRRGRPDRSWASADVSLLRGPCSCGMNNPTLTAVDANRPRLPTPPAGNRCNDVPIRVRIALFRNAPKSHRPIWSFCNAADLLFMAAIARLPARHGGQHRVETLCARRRVHDVHRAGCVGVCGLPSGDGNVGTSWLLQSARRVKAWKGFLDLPVPGQRFCTFVLFERGLPFAGGPRVRPLH